ncbi:ribose transport system substrate-binding protein [Hydrogenoanaerobacterium saccharovorans]|uniref:Ribose transport system substrate-binding protein n=1 Tax=Hydrogenoanaerobacterium saccharovorans TaxID=474960 RepID=A0A1H7Z8J0_9FIRM|nr:sugar ABC transporter substrate-binding protein [Hydrogenoanaerobacterium saccharovorans]RPF48772.1 ribose transport system substrate-binding protein [Hydrogenoanaerobacterium saccharovorans]SEM54543.1 ribose transport system substrate-binding protein [Hydrogenoanaerobacterium saccharovorans]
MKKAFSLALALLMILSMVACGANQTPASPSQPQSSVDVNNSSNDAENIVIGYATKSSSSPFWVENIAGAKKAEKELGIKLNVIGPPVENDVSGQIAVLEDMITSKVNAIVVAPCGDVGVADVVKKAMSSQIPVIAVDNGVEGVDVDSLVCTDNYAAGQMAGKFIGEQIGGEGKVIIVNGIVAQGSGKGRRDGFVDYMKITYGDKVNVVEVTGDWDDQKALSGFEAALAANADVKAGYAAWDGAALAMHKVLKQEGRDDVVLCGFDCYEESLKLMNADDPIFKGDIAQNPSNMGYTAIMTAYAAIKGESIRKNIDTGTTMVTAENVANYAKQMGVVLN